MKESVSPMWEVDGKRFGGKMYPVPYGKTLRQYAEEWMAEDDRIVEMHLFMYGRTVGNVRRTSSRSRRNPADFFG